MAKVRIAGRKALLEDVLSALEEAGVVHLTDANAPGAAAGDLAPCEEPARLRSRREALGARLRSVEELAALLGIDLGGEGPAAAEPLPDLDQGLESARSLAAERDELRGELAVAERYRRLCQAFSPVLASLGRLRHVASLGVTLDARYRDQVLPALRGRLQELTDGAYQLLWRPLDEETVGILLIFPQSAAPEVSSFLSHENIQEIRLPRKYEGLPLQEGLPAVERLLRELPDRLQELERSLAELADSHRTVLPAEATRLRQGLERTEVVRFLASTRYLFLIQGYVPRSALTGLRGTLDRRFGQEVEVQALPIPPGERGQVPIAFENPRFFRPFERLLSLLPPPRYGTIDPTPLVALSFPLFFGLILGDAGYGLVLLGLAWGAGRRWKTSPLGADVAFLLAVVGISSVLFGLLYGEFFGDLGHHLGLRPLWADRLQAAAALLALTVAVGVGHVLLGFVLATIQDLRGRLPGKALARVANVVALAGLLTLLAGLAQFLPGGAWRVGAAALVAAVAVLLYLEGPLALVEFVSALGNILSYSRLMALGLASAALAVVANRLGGAAASAVVGVLVAVVLHGLNLVLGLFSPTVHSLRLHYVEFLPRFYKYGGRPYRPFRRGGAP